MPPICLATEDKLSEDVAARLISNLNSGLEVGLTFRRRGSGYLKANVDKFCEIARRSPLLLITDLDNYECPASLIAKWMGNISRPKNLIFCVAVREVEAWLLADHVGMRKLLAKGASNLPREPDSLSDPKRTLLQLAQKAPRDVRNDLLIEKGAIASQGLGYNHRMGDFVRDIWEPERAAARSKSLNRAIARLRQFEEA